MYTDLLQIPTLVLDDHGVPEKNLTPQSFQMQLDFGPAFHPSAVHAEGSEPLSLALVLDASGDERELIAALMQSPGKGLLTSFLPHDDVSVYAFDCKLIRSAEDLPAPEATAHGSVAQALASPNLHKPHAPAKTCRSSKHLWDGLGAAATDLARQPGRRVLLVVSDGEDDGSRTTFTDLKTFVSAKNIVVFGLRERQDHSRLPNSGVRFASSSFLFDPDDLAEIADQSGGLVLMSDPAHVAQELEHLVTLVRSRYILQFHGLPMTSEGHIALMYMWPTATRRSAPPESLFPCATLHS